jgi:hypothetical protein
MALHIGSQAPFWQKNHRLQPMDERVRASTWLSQFGQTGKAIAAQ